MIVIRRDGQTIVIRGWRAWLVGASAVVVAWLLLAAVVFLWIGLAVTIAIVLLLAVPAMLIVALLQWSWNRVARRGSTGEQGPRFRS
jgi:hypothetical protein